MNSVESDKEYLYIVNSILNHDEFYKMKTIEHHGISRYEHSLKVSYYAYKIAKILKLDYEGVARGGLLHDFFFSSEIRSQKEKMLSYFTHPKYAKKNAINYFEINEKEQDIIRTHMFPANLALPKYAESWIVSIVDKIVALQEFSKTYTYQLVYLFSCFIQQSKVENSTFFVK